MEREVGGGIGMGNTCKPMADLFQCMTKPTTIKKLKKIKILGGLIRSHLCIFALFLLPWETDLKEYCYDLCQKLFCLCSLLGV